MISDGKNTCKPTPFPVHPIHSCCHYRKIDIFPLSKAKVINNPVTYQILTSQWEDVLPRNGFAPGTIHHQRFPATQVVCIPKSPLQGEGWKAVPVHQKYCFGGPSLRKSWAIEDGHWINMLHVCAFSWVQTCFQNFSSEPCPSSPGRSSTQISQEIVIVASALAIHLLVQYLPICRFQRPQPGKDIQKKQCKLLREGSRWPPRRVSLAMQAWLPCSLWWVSVKGCCAQKNRCETCPHLVRSVLQHSTPRCNACCHLQHQPRIYIKFLCVKYLHTCIYVQNSCSSIESHKTPWYHIDTARDYIIQL